ncbi:unnamed protein product [Ceratitis capitata]|uniref:(Mediterranean fruit fly) hypothetical protein n=1 Tax=Ceratitis capitata TaxID=7213 RepID=A0A811V4B4_CERCA|nr:unnamed protein product [Ceratitis capitata]
MHGSRKILSLALVQLLFLSKFANPYLKFTNIKCSSLDKSYVVFQKCRLTVPKREQIAMSIYAKLLKLPVVNASVNLSLFKKASGFRPFLYNVSANFCEFMEHRKRFPFLEIFFDALLKESNINHTCPFNHDIIVKDMILQEKMFRRIPVPPGDYMFQLLVAAFNDWKADVKAYFTIRLNRDDH